ncbi:MAG: flagellar hook protein FlgE [Chitinivorax sp.]
MGFQQGLSGLNVSAKNLDVIGNNVANSNTVGFKSSRTEFADIFASTIVGVAGTQAGIGAYVSKVAQQFTQGNITSSANPLDIAINNNGFFRMESAAGATSYTRNGQFKLDKSGFIVDNGGNYLTGYGVTKSVDPLTGLAKDAADRGQPLRVRIDPGAQNAPQATGASVGGEPGVLLSLNLDARAVTPTAAFISTGSTGPVPGPAVLGKPIPDPSSYNSATSITTYDSEGGPHTLTTYYVKTATPNEWDVYMLADGTSMGNVKVLDPANAPQTQTTANAAMRVVFDNKGNLVGYRVPANAAAVAGNPSGVTNLVTAPPDIQLDLQGIATEQTTINQIKGINTVVTTGANPTLTFPLSFKNSTQFGSNFGIGTARQDGFAPGQLAGFSVSPEGAVQVRYTNGQTKTAAFIRLANFANAQGLQPAGNNQWVQSYAAGDEVTGLPGDAGFGTLQSGAVEDSNVDLTAELVNMITAQRTYQANAQTVKTQDQILQTLVNLR